MVNNDLVCSHRAKALELLRSSSQPMPVKTLMGELSLSRVALWKLVRRLQELGYPIQTSRRGYSLPPERDPDLLCPWELGAYGSRCAWYPETSSTMEAAKKNFPPLSTAVHRDGASLHYTLAETQTRGRGRFQRTWESAPGGIYCTLTLRRRVPLAIVGRYTLLAAAVWAETLEELFPQRLSSPSDSPIRLKWPNDILLGNRKLGGILLDMVVEGDMATTLYLGFGINVRNQAPTPTSISLYQTVGPALPPRRVLLTTYLKRLEHALGDPYLPGFLERWKRFAATLGKPVLVSFPGAKGGDPSPIRGIAVDVGPGGELGVRTGKGEYRMVAHGDCRHRKSIKLQLH